MKLSTLEALMSLAVIVGALFLFWMTFDFPPPIQPNAPGPDLFPRIILVSILFFAVLLMVDSVRKRKIYAMERITLDYFGFFIILGSLILYLFLLPRLGFIAVSFLYLFLSLSLLTRMKSRFKALWVSCLGVAAFYILFVIFLRVDLPVFSLRM